MDSVGAVLETARTLYNEGRFEEAEQLLLTLQPAQISTSRQVLHLLGMCKYRGHRYEEGKALFLQELGLVRQQRNREHPAASGGRALNSVSAESEVEAILHSIDETLNAPLPGTPRQSPTRLLGGAGAGASRGNGPFFNHYPSSSPEALLAEVDGLLDEYNRSLIGGSEWEKSQTTSSRPAPSPRTRRQMGAGPSERKMDHAEDGTSSDGTFGSKSNGTDDTSEGDLLGLISRCDKAIAHRKRRKGLGEVNQTTFSEVQLNGHRASEGLTATKPSAAEVASPSTPEREFSPGGTPRVLGGSPFKSRSLQSRVESPPSLVDRVKVSGVKEESSPDRQRPLLESNPNPLVESVPNSNSHWGKYERPRLRPMTSESIPLLSSIRGTCRDFGKMLARWMDSRRNGENPMAGDRSLNVASSSRSVLLPKWFIRGLLVLLLFCVALLVLQWRWMAALQAEHAALKAAYDKQVNSMWGMSPHAAGSDPGGAQGSGTYSSTGGKEWSEKRNCATFDWYLKPELVLLYRAMQQLTSQ
jgi:hypothetical protein